MRGTKKSASFIFPTLAHWGNPVNLYRSMGNNKFSPQTRQAAIPGAAPGERNLKLSQKVGRTVDIAPLARDENGADPQIRPTNNRFMEIFCNFLPGVSCSAHDSTVGARPL